MDDAEFRRVHRRELIEDRINGASRLARQALDSLGAFAQSCSADGVAELRRACLDFAEELQYARPSMAPIYDLVERWSTQVARLPDQDMDGFRRAAARIAQELTDASLRAVDDIASRAARLIGQDAVVITHSLSSTAQATLRDLAPRGVHAIVTEARPGLEGRRQALHLDQCGMPVWFITDAQIGHFVQFASVALVGADAVLRDGAVVNKAGTYLLAIAAQSHNVPFYVCCESFKQAPYTSAQFDLETVDPEELDAPRGRNITPYNVYFDITPADLIDAWIHEDGITHPTDRAPA